MQAAVKQWKKDKKKKSSSPFDEINLFPEIAEAGNQSDNVVEYEPNLDFNSSDSELNSVPTEIDESVDEILDELIPTQNDKLNILQGETLTINFSEENSDEDLIAMRDEMQKLLAEITELMRRAAQRELADTFQILKSVRDLLN